MEFEENHMKRFVVFGLAVLLGFQTAFAGSSSSGLGQRRRPPRRVVVSVHKGFPLRRPLRHVVIHPVRVSVRVVPARFLPAVFWSGVVIASAPRADILVWEDAEILNRDEDWAEFTLNCDNTGTRVWAEVAAGRVQFDWAEIVFANGDAQVVDMKEWERGTGYYELFDFRAGRKVDHVRMVARAVSSEAKIALKMEK